MKELLIVADIYLTVFFMFKFIMYLIEYKDYIDRYYKLNKNTIKYIKNKLLYNFMLFDFFLALLVYLLII